MSGAETACAIFERAIRCVSGFDLVKAMNPLPQADVVCGVGKASASMALGVVKRLARPVSGLVIDKPPRTTVHDELEKAGIRVMFGAHPVPDRSSLETGAAMREFASNAQGRVIFCLSGGASALMEDLREGMSLAELSARNREWLSAGMTIQEINVRRRVLSNMKGGGLARLFSRAQVTVLVVSDVEGDDLATIGSGPFFDGGPLAEHIVIGNRENLRTATAKAARELGFQAVLAPDLSGDVSAACQEFLEMGSSLSGGEALIAVGETTVEVRGGGMGGRAQHFVTQGAIILPDRAVLLCAGSDGSDGPTDAAGGVVDHRYPGAAEYLSNNDSYGFLSTIGGLIKTGPTGTNVNDLALLLRI
jgi:hydroxypyruvate reductase